MEFSVNHPLLFLMAGILVAVVLAQSVFFLVKAYRRGIQLGMDPKKIKKTIVLKCHLLLFFAITMNHFSIGL